MWNVWKKNWPTYEVRNTVLRELSQIQETCPYWFRGKA